ncbi:MAG: hypothetical protein ABFS05_09885 [Bacteroidota bacterium]
MRNFINLLIWFFVIAPLTGCTITYKYGPYIGKVIDAQTEEPIEGAAVHIRFHTSTPDVGGGHSTYAGSVECLTNKNGEFNVSYRATTFRFFSLWGEYAGLVVFKPEYGAFPRYKGTSITPDSGVDGIKVGNKSIIRIIRLPKLNTKKERRNNLSSLYLGRTPLEEMKIIKKLANQERIYLGLEPLKASEYP